MWLLPAGYVAAPTAPALSAAERARRPVRSAPVRPSPASLRHAAVVPQQPVGGDLVVVDGGLADGALEEGPEVACADAQWCRPVPRDHAIVHQGILVLQSPVLVDLDVPGG